MGRRSLILYGILLLCVFMAGCSNRSIKTSDELITKDYDKNVDNEGLNEDNDMTENEKLREDSLVAYEQEAYANDLGTNEQEPEADNHTAIEQESKANSHSVNEQEPEDDNIERNPAGSIINTADLSKEILDSLFYIEEPDQGLIDRITGKSYKEDADIPYSELRYIHLLHMGFDGLTHVGEMIVNKAIADDVIDIFKELYAMGYPIEKILLVDEYDADDLKSMADNNSSSFNYRFVEGTTKQSNHSFGLAIDINPLYNPYVRSRDGRLEILPENATEYADRDRDNKYYIRKDDPCYKAFISRGFTWGGEWKNSKDYQHFEKKIAD